MRTTLTLVTLCLGCHLALADIHPASSPYSGDINSAIALCSSGDIVTVPAGIGRVTNMINFNKAISVIGAGIGQTVLKDYGTTECMLKISTGNSSNLYRLSGITFTNGNISAQWAGDGSIQVYGSSTNVRIDHVKAINLLNRGICVYGAALGVIDHCDFTYINNGHPIMFSQESLYGRTMGDGSWEHDVNYGTPEFMVVENCTFNGDDGGNSYVGAFDGFNGAKYVVRYCQFTNTYLGHHGTDSSQRYRGTRACEVYGNTIVRNSTHSNTDHVFEDRGGTALFFSNHVIFKNGGFNNLVKLRSYRNFYPFQPWGVVDGTKEWDGTNHTILFSGQATAKMVNTVRDTTKSFTANALANGSCVRIVFTNTAIAGSGAGTVVVAGTPWSGWQWIGWEITKISNNQKGHVSGNSSHTLTMDSSYFVPAIAAGDEFVLSWASPITGNTATDISFVPSDFWNWNAVLYPSMTISNGWSYEVRLPNAPLDQSGRGKTDVISENGPMNHLDLHQGSDPCYIWGNTSPISGVGGEATIKVNRDYYLSAKPGYYPLVYPHPLVQEDTNSPAIGTQPLSTVVNAGSNATFSVTPSLGSGLLYQWYKGSSPIAGKTLSSYTLLSVSTNDAGSFFVTLTNGYGSATSAVATLTVQSPATPPSPPTGLRVFIGGASKIGSAVKF